MISTDYRALYAAWQNFIKGKKRTFSIDQFAYRLEVNLVSLWSDINSETYRHGPYVGHIINEKKRRDISVATVRDRIVHRLVYDHLVNIWDKTLDSDVYSCRKEKGLHKGLRRTQQILLKHHSSFVWRADVTKFFDSVDQAKLLKILKSKIDSDSILIGLCREVINSHNSEGSGQGIPIGNLTSQIFSNIYLNEFDRYVRHILKPQAYVRYGDDFILFTKTNEQAIELRKNASIFLTQELKLATNPKNDIIIRAKDGLKFLGHKINESSLTVDKHTSKSILAKVNSENIASYRAMYLNKDLRKEIEWKVMQQVFDITT